MNNEDRARQVLADLLNQTASDQQEAVLRSLASAVETALKPFSSTADRLRQIAAGVRHSGDYAKLWWNPQTQTVWWSGADADFDVDQGHTNWPELQAAFQAVPEVLEVLLEAEADPVDLWDSLDTDSATDWVELDYQPNPETAAWFEADYQRFIAQHDADR